MYKIIYEKYLDLSQKCIIFVVENKNMCSIKDILTKVQSFQRRIKCCGVTMTIDYSIGYDSQGSIDVYVHSDPAHCERFTFSSFGKDADREVQMIYLKEHLKEIKAFKE